MLKYLGGYAAKTANTLTERLRNDAATALENAGAPEKLAQGAAMLGVSDDRQQQLTSIISRLGLMPYKSPAIPLPHQSLHLSQLPLEVLEKIGSQLDSKDRQSFAASGHVFAKAAGSAVDSLTFHGPFDMETSCRIIADSLIGFSAHGIHQLTLEDDHTSECNYTAQQLQHLPGWLRASVREVTVQAPLTADAWDYLQTLPSLKTINMADMAGREHNAVLQHLPPTQPELHLKMPLAEGEMAKLQRFERLDQLHISVKPGISLDHVMDTFRERPLGPPPGMNLLNAEDQQLALKVQRDSEKLRAAEREPTPLDNAAIKTLNFTVDHRGRANEQHSLFADTDVERLPRSLTSFSLSGVAASHPMIDELKKLKLESLSLGKAALLSGDLLKELMSHPTLTAFSAPDCQLDSTDARTIAANTRLEKVSVRGNKQIGDKGIQALVQNKNITHLDVANCGGSDKYLYNLARHTPEHLQRVIVM